MIPSVLFLTLLSAIAPSLARAAITTTSDSSTINLFVIDPTGALPSPTIHASIIRVVPRLTQTEYYITCAPLTGDKYFGKPKPAPCNHIDGASVTINPTGMTLHLVRTSQIIDGRQGALTKETVIEVTATATCRIDGSTTASCAGAMTSSATTRIFSGTATQTTQSTVEVETISSVFGDVAGHSIPVTITAGFENIPTSSTAVKSSSSTGGAAGARATGGVRVVAAGVVGVVVGGVAVL